MTDPSLEHSVLQALAYSNCFDHPLLADEVYRTMPQNSVVERQVFEVLESLRGEALIGGSQGYYYCDPTDQTIVARRQVREVAAMRWIRRARRVATLIRVIPFVRAVCLSGSLSKDVANDDDDIDFVIIVSPDRVWISRTIFTLIKKLFLFNYNRWFCINLILAENAMCITPQNRYAAMEVATVRPIWGKESWERFQAENAWIREYLPNWSPLDPYRNMIQRTR